ncbi:hypothetical protein DPMN_038407 [Dreissena polymorpha]|uniref:Uncharacterized protein n=1 Tax=Dreissena polymorpha TaxID=45954 RepID=A0A9D4RNM4_DREPO|nr:hypothetical protein DPMN_038407 [Dreissena polymorpha]
MDQLHRILSISIKNNILGFAGLEYTAAAISRPPFCEILQRHIKLPIFVLTVAATLECNTPKQIHYRHRNQGDFSLSSTTRKWSHVQATSPLTATRPLCSNTWCNHNQCPLRMLHRNSRKPWLHYKTTSLVYLDRKIWLADNGCHGNIVIVFDEFILPRNLSLIAIKPDRHQTKTSQILVY